MKKLVVLLILPLTGCQVQASYFYRSAQEVVSLAPATIEESYRQVRPSVVSIYSYASPTRPTSLGSGFIYRNDGSDIYVATNHHVIDGGKLVHVFFDEVIEHEAQVVGSFPDGDLALLKVKVTDQIANYQALVMANSDLVKPGERVFAVGNPLDKELYQTATLGYVSAVDRTLSNVSTFPELLIPLIQNDLVLNPGNSGGPLFNALGRVIGVNTYKLGEEQNYQRSAFAIEINFALRTLAEIERVGSGAFFSPGLKLRTNLSVSGYANFCSEVNKSRVKSGDQIIAVNGQEVTTRQQYRRLLQSTLEDSVWLTLLRQGKSVKEQVFLSRISDLEDAI